MTSDSSFCPSCAICNRQSERSLNPNLVVWETDDWLLRHSLETNIVGYLVLESKRHFLDLSEATKKECDGLPFMLQSATSALRRVAEAERVYTYTLAEVVPHYHVHMVPRTATMPRAYRGRGILQFPISPGADTTLAENMSLRLKKHIQRMLP